AVTTRAARVREENEASYHPLGDLPGPLGRLYHETARQLFVTYFALAEQLEPAFKRRSGGEGNARERAIAAVSGLLPAGQRTRLDVRGDARSVAELAAHLHAMPLAEAADL